MATRRGGRRSGMRRSIGARVSSRRSRSSRMGRAYRRARKTLIGV